MKYQNPCREIFKQLTVIAMFFILALPNKAMAVTKTLAATGNWNSAATWSPAGVPAAGDDVVIRSFTVTVDSVFSCRNLYMGDATAANATLNINAASSLTITGDLQMNPSNKANTFVLNANAGILNIGGTFSYWSTTGTNSIRTATGTINITPAISITNANQNITYTGAGTINFSNTFTDSYNKLVTFAGCTVNFSKSYVVNTTAASWAGKGTAVFAGSGFSITPTSNLTLFNVQFTGSTTLNSGAGAVVVGGDLTIASGVTFTAGKDFDLNGNWTNNGTFTSGGYSVAFNGGTKTIGGTSSTAFGTLQFGSATAAVTQSCTLNKSATCTSLIFHGGANARTLTLPVGDTLTVNGNATLNQPTAAVTSSLTVGAGVCNITGDLTFAGTNNTATFVSRVAVTTGSFVVGGNVNWMSNTAVATEVITATTGSITFSSPLTMGSGSGTLTVTGTGTINFNGTSSTSFVFGGATAPVFTNVASSNIYFKRGFTNNTNALTFNATSNIYLSGSGTVTPNAAITFGNLALSASAVDTLAAGSAVIVKNFTLNASSSLKLNQNLQVDGNWTNNGGSLLGGSNTVTLNGTTKTIGGTSATSFPNLQIGTGAATVSYTMNNNNSCADLTFSNGALASTLTITVGDTLAASGNLTLNQPTAAVTSQLAVNAGVCTVAGNLVFSGTSNTATFINKVAVTSGTFNLTGSITWMSNTAVATEVISATTGNLIFGSSVAMGSGSGTISVTGAGTIRFNGATAPSFDFGGAATVPVFTTAAASSIYFNKGFTNSTNALTFNATSTSFFSSNGTITPNAAITFGHLQLSAGATDTLASAAGAVIIAGDVTLATGSTFKANKDFEADGNWTNNGGTFNGGTSTVIFNGGTKTIGGTTATTFYNLQMGNTAVTLNYTANANVNCNNLEFTASTLARTLTLSNGVVLTVNGTLTINQPTANAKTNTLAVNAGICVVNGNLVFAGIDATTTRIARIATTSGAFTLAGTITWMANTVSATEVITTATGSLNFSSSITMGSASGTIAATGTGDINFNGTSAPSLSFGGATAPVLTTAFGSNVSFAKGLSASTTALTFVTGSTAIFSGAGTITPTAAITFSNVQINSGAVATAAGNFTVAGSWANNGTFVPSTYTVTFNGGGAKTISRSGGETFYSVSAPSSNIQMLSNVTITNSLTLGGALIDLNGNTLTLGNGAGASLTYTAGRVFGGVFKRWFPASAITSNSGSFYGLFPIGTSTQYRPVTINSTANPTTAGYVSAIHVDDNGATSVTYTDNQGVAIEQFANMHSDLTTSGLAGGTYSLDVKFTSLGTMGSVNNLRLITNGPGSYGTHSATTSTVSAPLAHRTGLTVSNLNNAWVISTTNKAVTPLFNYVYSRKTGNWNDSTATGTWSYTPGGAGAPCSCMPLNADYATIEATHVVTVTGNETVKFLDVKASGAVTINSAQLFNVTGTMTMIGASTFTNNGTLKVDNELVLSSAVSPTVNGNVQVMGQLTMPTGTAYTQSTGTLTLNGNLSLSGTLNMASGATLVFSGTGAHLNGTGTYTTAAGGSFPVTNNKVIDAGTILTFGTSGTNTTFAIASNGTIFNQGNITVNGDITGGNAASSWENYANSSLTVTGTILATGALDAATVPNTVSYSGSGAQIIKVPVSSYNILTATNAGTKTLAGNIVVDNALTLGGSVILDESTSSISGAAALNMSGTAELKLSRSAAATYPELTGTYTCTGGTVTINQTAANAVVAAKNYYNLKLNGATAYDLSGVSSVANNLDIQNTAYLSNNGVLTVGGTLTYATSGTTTLTDSIAVNGIVLTSGTIQDGGRSINVYGTGGWSKASGATFTPSTGTVYFTGAGAQTLGGTSASQTFYGLCINKSSNTVTVGGSTTALTLNGDLTLRSGTFDKGTAATITMADGDWISSGGSFTAGSGTVLFNASADQAIRGTASSASFNNITLNNPGFKLAADESVTTINIAGDVTLTAGTLDAATATNINMTSGNWTSNGATFIPRSSTITFNGSGAQAINGTDTIQTFNSITVDKSAGTLSIGGSTAALVLNGNHTITAGGFNAGTATAINVAGNWTMTGGTFTNTGSTVTMNGTSAQTMSSTAAFNNLKIDNATAYVSLGTNVTINGTLTFANGLIRTNAYSVVLPLGAVTTGVSATSYIHGNEQIAIPNTATPAVTFEIGDASRYAPVQISFAGTTSGSGSITAVTTAGDDADIRNAGIAPGKSVNRTWTLSNSGVAGFTSFSATYNFDAADVDAPATPANFVARRYNGATWDTTIVGTRAATATQVTNETTFGKIQIGEKGNLLVNTQPRDSAVCIGTPVTLISTSGSAPAPTVKWQRDANTGTFTDINGSMDGGVYSGFTTTSLNIANVTGLANYKYRAVFANLNGTVNSDSAVITINTLPSATVAYQSCAGVDGNTTLQISGTGGPSPFTYRVNSNAFNSYDTVRIGNGSNNNVYVKDANGCISAATNYTATAVVPTVIAGTGSNTTCGCPSVAEGRDLYLTNTSGELIAIINDMGHNLGTITATTYMRPGPVLVNNAQGGHDAAMSRSWVLDFAGTNLVPNVQVKFPFTTAELNDLAVAAAGTPIASDDIASINDLGSTQYEGPTEDDTYNTADATMLVRHAQIGNGSILNGEYVTIALASNGEHWLHGNSNGAALPVKLVSFEATANLATTQVETRWTTALEINNNYFAVERSEDGINFNQVGRLQGAGTTTATTDYRFNDVKPLNGLSYYRLKQVDFDGDFTYSDVVAVNLGTYGSVTMYPNPTQNEVNLGISNPSGETNVNIYDLNGHQVYGRSFDQGNTSNNQVITIQTKDILSAGMYMVNVTSNGTVFQQKLIVN
jgi:hypothetical protein